MFVKYISIQIQTVWGKVVFVLSVCTDLYEEETNSSKHNGQIRWVCRYNERSINKHLFTFAAYMHSVCANALRNVVKKNASGSSQKCMAKTQKQNQTYANAYIDRYKLVFWFNWKLSWNRNSVFRIRAYTVHESILTICVPYLNMEC